MKTDKIIQRDFNILQSIKGEISPGTRSIKDKTKYSKSTRLQNKRDLRHDF